MSTGTQVLAEAFGSLARGFKLLRKYALEHMDGPELGGVSQGGGSTSDDPESSEPEPETPEEEGKPWVFKPPDRFYVDYGVKKLEFTDTPSQFLTKPRTKAFRQCYRQHLFTTLVGGRVRADRFRSAWVADETTRRGWRNISQQQLLGVFAMVQEFHEKCVALLSDTTYEEFYRNVGKLPLTKFNRRHYITDVLITWKAFRTFVRDEHRKLPSVCGSKPKKKILTV